MKRKPRPPKNLSLFQRSVWLAVTSQVLATRADVSAWLAKAGWAQGPGEVRAELDNLVRLGYLVSLSPATPSGHRRYAIAKTFYS